MTSTFQNYSSAHYSPNLQEHVLFGSPNVYHDAEPDRGASPPVLSTRDFFTSITHHRDYTDGSYYKELQQPHIHQLDQVNDDFGSNGGSCEHIENESSDNGLKFSIWKKEDHTSTTAYNDDQKSSTKFHVKWISSEMRLMNNTDPTNVNSPRISTTTNSLKLEDQKQPSSDPMETDNTSNTTSSNTMISNINHPIRVCSDCNTTKTPLWRSGPQGPKSLCNACGIRQRKARRAMAAAAAANGTSSTRMETKSPVLIKKSKTLQKDKTKKSNILKGSSSVVSTFKKQGKMAAPSSHQDKKKLCLEDFLLSLSKNLAFYTVFPQDEKEAAILLMALSFGHAHG